MSQRQVGGGGTKDGNNDNTNDSTRPPKKKRRKTKKAKNSTAEEGLAATARKEAKVPPTLHPAAPRNPLNTSTISGAVRPTTP